MIYTDKGEEMLQLALTEMGEDKDALDSLQRYYNAYTAECEVLRKEEGNADGVSEKYTEKAADYLSDWLIYKASEALSDYTFSEEAEEEEPNFQSELDRRICEELLYDASAPYEQRRVM